MTTYTRQRTYIKKILPVILIILLGLLFACTKAEPMSGDGGDGAGASGESYSSSIGKAMPGPGSGGGDSTLQPGLLTAGEWNDAGNWDFWRGLQANDTIAGYQQKWGFYPQEKWKFTVKDANGNGAGNAVIIIKSSGKEIWKGRTDRLGVLNVMPGIFELNAGNLAYEIFYKNSKQASGSLDSNKNITINLSSVNTVNTTIDLLFTVDATGSMGDELSYLKAELLDVLNRVNNELPGKAFRFSSVFYRDIGDQYVTKALPFTNDRLNLVNFVKDQNADNGGDFPEAVDEALKTAMEQSWSENARARMMFLILDAPPHETDQNLSLTRKMVKLAAEKGVMIIPISASGIDKSNEFLFRYFALATNGTYVFLTNHSGIGGNHIAPTIGDYKVEYLNDLMVRLIKKYGGD